jgi:hypothetical protein
MKKRRVVTYGQMFKVLADMLRDGYREMDDPFCMNGQFWEKIIDARTDKILCIGKMSDVPNPERRIKLV